ncbi:MAG: ribonuclease [Clostridiales bacterium]|nr:ribonuclease [Clostridiales bacterium]
MGSLLKRILSVITIISLAAGISGCAVPEWSYETASETTGFTSATSSETTGNTETTATSETEALIDEDGAYTHADDVALYIHTYGHLPHNFITKRQARELGWSSGGLDDYLYEGCIGGDRFGNYEETLPEADGRDYFECDIDTMHQRSRGAKRIVYSDDGLIYYTVDHYSTFELLYGEP